jgi:hypothetical protein
MIPIYLLDGYCIESRGHWHFSTVHNYGYADTYEFQSAVQEQSICSLKDTAKQTLHPSGSEEMSLDTPEMQLPQGPDSAGGLFGGSECLQQATVFNTTTTPYSHASLHCRKRRMESDSDTLRNILSDIRQCMLRVREDCHQILVHPSPSFFCEKAFIITDHPTPRDTLQGFDPCDDKMNMDGGVDIVANHVESSPCASTMKHPGNSFIDAEQGLGDSLAFTFNEHENQNLQASIAHMMRSCLHMFNVVEEGLNYLDDPISCVPEIDNTMQELEVLNAILASSPPRLVADSSMQGMEMPLGLLKSTLLTMRQEMLNPGDIVFQKRHEVLFGKSRNYADMRNA